MVGKVKCAVRKWFQKQNTIFLKDGFQKLVQRWRKCIEVLVILWKNNYAALKIIDVGIFLFFISLKYLFPFIFYLSGGKIYQPALAQSNPLIRPSVYTTPRL